MTTFNYIVTILLLVYIIGCIVYQIIEYRNNPIVKKYRIGVKDTRTKIKKELKKINQYNVYKQIKTISQIVNDLYLKLSFVNQQDYIDNFNLNEKKELEDIFDHLYPLIYKTSYNFQSMINKRYLYNIQDEELMNLCLATQSVLSDVTSYLYEVYSYNMERFNFTKYDKNYFKPKRTNAPMPNRFKQYNEICFQIYNIINGKKKVII